ncbi:Cell division protein FtsL [bioreactor metagenome]|uniref:Cell division protein FtsL n=1 Tax=bioreactor metagenome TaxID=1076179 RepID=A0A645HGK7_9ZZZZ
MASKPDTRIIRKTSRRNIVPRIIIGLVLIVTLASAMALYFDQEEQITRIRSERTRLDAALADAQARNDELKKMQALVGTDAYIEWVARNQLGMVRPDEVILSDG